MFAAAAEHGLVLSFLLGPADLAEVDRMCGRFPEAPVILDHVGGVRLRDGRIDPAELESLTALSRHPRVYVKLGPIHALGGGRPPLRRHGASAARRGLRLRRRPLHVGERQRPVPS